MSLPSLSVPNLTPSRSSLSRFSAKSGDDIDRDEGRSNAKADPRISLPRSRGTLSLLPPDRCRRLSDFFAVGVVVVDDDDNKNCVLLTSLGLSDNSAPNPAPVAPYSLRWSSESTISTKPLRYVSLVLAREIEEEGRGEVEAAADPAEAFGAKCEAFVVEVQEALSKVTFS